MDRGVDDVTPGRDVLVLPPLSASSFIVLRRQPDGFHYFFCRFLCFVNHRFEISDNLLDKLREFLKRLKFQVSGTI